jgi:cytochrome P450
MAAVEFEERSGTWHVHGHPEALAVLTDPGTFSSDTLRLFSDLIDPAVNDGNIVQTDGAAHRTLRGLVSQAFTPRTVADLEPRIRALTGELLDAADERGGLELVADLAYPLPVTVIAELLGVPASDRDLFREWADIVFEDSVDLAVDADLDDGAKAEIRGEVQSQLDRLRPMYDYMAGHAAERRRRPRQDLLTRLVEAEVDGERLTDRQIGSFANILLAAGHATTTLLLGNAVLCLDENPAQAAAVRADRSLVPAVIEEAVRLRTPFNVLARATTAETVLGGETLPADRMVLVWLNSTNRDPRVFADPDRFDPGRDPNPHLSFGRGVHFCLGAPLARLEARIVLGMLLDRYPALRTIPDEPPTPLAVTTMTGVSTLPLSTREAD